MVNIYIKFQVTVLSNIVFWNNDKYECVAEKNEQMGGVQDSDFDIVFKNDTCPKK